MSNRSENTKAPWAMRRLGERKSILRKQEFKAIEHGVLVPKQVNEKGAMRFWAATKFVGGRRFAIAQNPVQSLYVIFFKFQTIVCEVEYYKLSLLAFRATSLFASNLPTYLYEKVDVLYQDSSFELFRWVFFALINKKIYVHRYLRNIISYFENRIECHHQATLPTGEWRIWVVLNL